MDKLYDLSVGGRVSQRLLRVVGAFATDGEAADPLRRNVSRSYEVCVTHPRRRCRGGELPRGLA